MIDISLLQKIASLINANNIKHAKTITLIIQGFVVVVKNNFEYMMNNNKNSIEVKIIVYKFEIFEIKRPKSIKNSAPY